MVTRSPYEVKLTVVSLTMGNWHIVEEKNCGKWNREERNEERKRLAQGVGWDDISHDSEKAMIFF